MSSMASTQSLEQEVPGKEGAKAVEAAPEKKNRSRPYVILAVVVTVALAGYGSFAWLSRGHENTDDAQVDADVVAISTRVSGALLKVHVTDNQTVKKRDLLVEIDPADLAAREKQAEAELAAAKAQSQAADAQVAIVEATSRGGLSAAQAQLSGSARRRRCRRGVSTWDRCVSCEATGLR